ncbi:MAG: hypothetical protein ACREM3_08000 [Candidatus Rokuibacteriota bacterium]
MSRLSWGAGFAAILVVGPGATGFARALAAEVRVAPGWRVEVVATRLPRPAQLAFRSSGRLVVLSHGWRGDAAAEIFELDVDGPLPIDAAATPRVVVPFAEEPRKAVFGSLVVSPRSEDLLLGEENGNRIYRLTRDERLTALAVGMHHLVGGSSMTFDRAGRLVVLDFASPETRLRSEKAPPRSLDWLSAEGYQGPLVFRIDPAEPRPLPRRIDLLAPVFPRGWSRAAGKEPRSRFISVAALPTGEVMLLDSLGEMYQMTPDGVLQGFARLPAGHYHRTHMTVAPDGSVIVSSGFHIRHLLRVSPGGALTTVAWDLGDPEGIAVDRTGSIYVAEAALHRIIRIRPVL